MGKKKLGIKDERFCQEWITNGENATAAYLKVFGRGKKSDKVLWNKASAKLKSGEVQVRINEIREAEKARLADRYTITRDKITDYLLKVLDESEQKMLVGGRMREPDLVRKTAMDMAKLHGLVVQKDDGVAGYTVVVMNDIHVNGKPHTFNVGKPI